MIKKTATMQEVSETAEAVERDGSDAAAVEPVDVDPSETQEWLESLEDVYQRYGRERVSYLLTLLDEAAYRKGVELPFTANTPYINTIPVDKQPRYPGNREIERRIKSIVRWNAMAMVVRANREEPGIGGHISSYASSATLKSSRIASRAVTSSGRASIPYSPGRSITCRLPAHTTALSNEIQ